MIVVVFLAIVIADAFLFSSNAFAWLKVCNSSNNTTAWVAVALYHYNLEKWISEGWWKIEQGRCTKVLGGGPLRNKIYYLYAHGSRRVEWGGSYRFCTEKEAFSIHNAHECASFKKKGFWRVDTGDEVNYTVRLQ